MFVVTVFNSYLKTEVLKTGRGFSSKKKLWLLNLNTITSIIWDFVPTFFAKIPTPTSLHTGGIHCLLFFVLIIFLIYVFIVFTYILMMLSKKM